MMKYSMEFLCWVNRCLFPSDFETDLLSLGFDAGVAFIMARDLKNHRSITQLYQDYGLTDGIAKDALDAYLQRMQAIWNTNAV